MTAASDRNGAPRRLRLAAEVANLSTLREFVEAGAAAEGFDREAIDGMVLAVDEAATNIIVHGYAGERGEIELKLARKGDALVVQIRDTAPPFNPTTVPAPDVTLPLEQRTPGGLGIHLIRQFVDRLAYRRTPGGVNELILEIGGRDR